jgi:CheY-like chemotaxis protein
MIKKKFLFSDEFFCNIDPHLIASLIGPGYVAVTFFNEAKTYGGMINFPTWKVETDALLEDEVEYSKIDECLKEIGDLGDAEDTISVNVIGTNCNGSTIKVDEYEYALKKVIASFEQNEHAELKIQVTETPGAKIYFKNWTNELRIIEIDTPAFCLDNNGQGDTIKVLSVDDSVLVQNILKRTLGKYEDLDIVATASDAFAATEVILEKDPDIIILDVVMPQINGVLFLQQLMKSNPKPVIIFSTLAKSGGHIEKQAREFGAVDVVDKKKLTLSNQETIEYLRDRIREGIKTFNNSK